MRVLFVAALSLIGTACASTGRLASNDLSRARTDYPMVASMQPVAPTPPQTSSAEPESGNDSAGGLLERAFAEFNRDDYKAASKTFTRSINTNNLNEAGRALAYWHIYLAEKRLNNEDRSTDALSSFATVAQEIMDVREDTKYALNQSGDFVERFNLDTRLSRSRAILSAIWAKRVPGYGKSVDDAVPVFDQAEADYFVEIAPSCASAKRRQMDKHTVAHTDGHQLQRVTIFCEGQHSGTDYYLEVVSR